jgi:chemotaxis protein methyltransferase CheR
VDEPRRERWFRPAEGRLEVARAARDLVELGRHNLAREEPPGRFDLVLCRNVLIYFEPAAAARALLRLWGAVRPGGILLLGPVELPLAPGLAAEWIERPGATLLRKAEG